MVPKEWLKETTRPHYLHTRKTFSSAGLNAQSLPFFAGEAAYSAQDYYGAIDFFAAAGTAGKERWADAVYEQALVLIKNSEPDNAIKL